MENTLQVEISEISPVERKLSVTVPAERVSAIREKIVLQFINQAEIPGFRPGKAPRNLIENRFRNDIKKRTETEVINETLKEVVRARNLSVVALGELSTHPQPEGDGFRYSLTLEVLPEVTVTTIPRFRIKKPVRPVTEADIEEVLTNLRERYTQFRSAEKDESAQPGDLVKLEYRTQDAGKESLGSPEIYEGILSVKHLIPQVAQQLFGIKAGEEREFTLSYPDSPEVPEVVRGKRIHYHFTLKELRKAIPPQFTDAEVQNYFEEPNLEALRVKIRRSLEQANEERSRKVVGNELRRAVAETFQFPVPSSLVQEELKRLSASVLEGIQYRNQHQQEKEELAKRLVEKLRPIAENNVRVSLVLSQVAEHAGLAPTPQEVDLELSHLAQYYKMDPQQFFHKARETHLRDRVYAYLREEKALELLLKNAEIEEIPWEEWEKLNPETSFSTKEEVSPSLPGAPFSSPPQPHPHP